MLWTETVHKLADDPHGERLIMSGWAPAGHVQRLQNEDYSRVPRVDLGDEPGRWHGVHGPPGYWSEQGLEVGVLDGSDPLPHPSRRVEG